MTVRRPVPVKAPAVGIVDVGIGNIGSLTGALSRLGLRPRAVGTVDACRGLDRIILPGVGSAGFAMGRLRATGLDRFLQTRAQARDLPILGICLGMQLLFETSDEDGTETLGLLPGRVSALPDGMCHVGWAMVRALDFGAPPAAYFFNHAYWVDCPARITRSVVDIDGPRAAEVAQGPIRGVQFHPEKSQSAGLACLRTALGLPVPEWADA